MIWILLAAALVVYLVWDELRLERQDYEKGQAHPQDGADEWTSGHRWKIVPEERSGLPALYDATTPMTDAEVLDMLEKHYGGTREHGTD